MLALFFQLKMMQSLQFIATLYDDLSEVSGEKSKPNYTVPPFRQALTTMLTATKDAVVSEIDKQPTSVQSEFASLKTSLTDPAVSAPVKLQIPSSQFEAVKQKTYQKLNKHYTAPPEVKLNYSGVDVSTLVVHENELNQAGNRFSIVSGSSFQTIPDGRTAPSIVRKDQLCHRIDLYYQHHSNGDGVLKVYIVPGDAPRELLNTYYYVKAKNTFYAEFLNVGYYDYTTSADGFPIRCYIHDEDGNPDEGNFAFTVQNDSSYPTIRTKKAELPTDTDGAIAQIRIPHTDQAGRTVTAVQDLNNLMLSIYYTDSNGVMNQPMIVNPIGSLGPASAAPAPPAKASLRPKIAELGLQKVNDLQQVDGGDLLISGSLFVRAWLEEDGSFIVEFSNGDQPSFVYFYHVDWEWYVDPSLYKHYNIISPSGTVDIRTSIVFMEALANKHGLQAGDPDKSGNGRGMIICGDEYDSPAYNLKLLNEITAVPVEELKKAKWMFYNEEILNGASPLITPITTDLTVSTFSTDGLVNVNDATPVEYDVKSYADQLEIKVEQADDGSVKVTYHSPRNPGSAMFSAPVLGTFIHKGYQWYVDPTTYKSYYFSSSTNEVSLYQCTFLPNGELDMIAEASVNSSYQIPRDGFVSIPLTELNTGSFWFGGSSNSGTEPLNTPLTMKESFATFPGIPDFWKELHDSDYPRYSDQANITYNYKPHNPLWSSATGQNLTVIAQEYGDGYMTIQLKGPGETILTEFLYTPDGTVRAQPTATGGNYKLYQMLADDSLVNVQFKAYDWQGNDMIAAGGNTYLSIEEYENVRTLYPEHISGVENRLGKTMEYYTAFEPSNNFTNNAPLIQIMAGQFRIGLNNKGVNIIRPLNGNPIAYVDHADNQNPKISNHLLVEFGDMGRYLNIYAVHNSAMSTGGMPMIINDPTAKELLTQFEIAWPSNLSDLPTTPMKFRSTPQTKPLNLSYETLSRHGIQRISFVSVHETDRLVLGIRDVTPWGFTEIKGSTQDPTSGKWYNTFDNDPELIWNALVYDNTVTYETSYAFGNSLPMIVRVELPYQAFGYADYF